MNILLIILAVVAAYGMKFSVSGHNDYIDRAQTDSIKGFFAIIILFSHMRGYLPPPGEYDMVFYDVIEGIGQLMVVMFLLYSGYGVMESLKRDREKYVSTFLTHRLLKIWLMYFFAVSLFLILSIAIGKRYSFEQYLLCWTGWESIGNSNWFVFDILMLYLLTYFSLLIANRLKLNLKKCGLIVLLLTVLFELSLKGVGKESYWYDTIIAYPVGMLFSLYKTRIESLCRGYRWINWFLSSLSIWALFYFVSVSGVLSVNAPGKALNHFLFVVSSSFFALALVFLTMKMKIDNKALRWLGVNAFAIYMLQRLAMIICAHFELNDNSLVFSAIVIPSTLIIAAFFTAGTNRVNSILFKK